MVCRGIIIFYAEAQPVRFYTENMLEIRPCRHDDYSAVAQLLRQLWPSFPIDDDRLQDTFVAGLNSRAHHFHCAVEDGHVIGFCSVIVKNSLWQQGSLAHVDELVVDKAARGRGIGTQLLQNAIAIATGHGAARIELDSAFHRTEAHQFYQQHGFENRAYLFSKKLSAETEARRHLPAQAKS